MSRIGWITLVIAGTCAGFLVGATVGKGGRPEPAATPATRDSEAERAHAQQLTLLRASLEEYRAALAKKEDEVRDLQTELAQVGEKLLPSFTPDEGKGRAEYEEWKEGRRRSERSDKLREKTRDLRNKILQRKDPALRQQGLLELEALVKSDDPEDVLLGLTALPQLIHIKFDRDKLRPYVLCALQNENEEVRAAALECLGGAYRVEDHFDALLQMLTDPSDQVRSSAAWWVALAGRDDRKDEAVAALQSLLHDENKWFRVVAVHVLSDYLDAGQEVEDAAIEMSRDREVADGMLWWLRRRDNISEKVAQRLIETYDEGYRKRGYDGEHYEMDWVGRRVSEDAKPMVVDFCVRVLRESVVHDERTGALAGLQGLGDASVIPELEVMANTPDAEGIEDDLVKTIGYLRQRANEGR